MKQYFDQSHTAFYSVVAALPLLIGYEILLALTSTSYWVVRNAADVWLRTFLVVFDITSRQATFVMIGLLLASIPFIKQQETQLKFSYFVGMLVESFIYSLSLGIIIHTILKNIFLAAPSLSNQSLQNLALSLGAGLFEEFFFRVLLLNALFWLLKPLLKGTVITGLVAILSASFLFSLSHYVGGMADPFQLYSFLFRWMAGLIFTVLYFLRGFGVTAYTHAFYDILVLL